MNSITSITVNKLNLYNAIYGLLTIERNLCYMLHSSIKTHFIHWWQRLSCRVPTAHQKLTNLIHTLTHQWHNHQDHFGVPYLAQGPNSQSSDYCVCRVVSSSRLQFTDFLVQLRPTVLLWLWVHTVFLYSECLLLFWMLSDLPKMVHRNLLR